MFRNFLMFEKQQTDRKLSVEVALRLKILSFLHIYLYFYILSIEGFSMTKRSNNYLGKKCPGEANQQSYNLIKKKTKKNDTLHPQLIPQLQLSNSSLYIALSPAIYLYLQFSCFILQKLPRIYTIFRSFCTHILLVLEMNLYPTPEALVLAGNVEVGYCLNKMKFD